MIDIPFRSSITNRTRFIENISGVFPHLERRIYTSCLLLPAHYCYDRYFLSNKNYEPHAFHLLLPAHTCYDLYFLSSQYYERHAFYRKHFWCFSTFRTKNVHIYLVFLTYIMSSLSKNYKSHSTVLQNCLLLT